ncbi:MAG: carboxypeptidase-like regulatory domain-containing protein [Bacteroidetes bacterium]|nr:MAG: carboxypeptidase-like regulatory domain-containing protein [Bacteroidota bacterium]
MKKLTLSVAAMLMAFTFTFAMGPKEIAKDIQTVSLSGQVMDMLTGEALAGVKIMVEETNEISYTDFDGKFTFEGLLPGGYKISTNLISYKSSDLKIDTEKTQKVEVKLEQLSRR